MSVPIQDGRYRIWRSPEQHQLIVSGYDSMAFLSHPRELQNQEEGIWIVSSTPSTSPNLSSAATVSATLRNAASETYLALNDPTEPGRNSGVSVKGNEQVWNLSPASTTGGEGASKNEFYIGYPDSEDGGTLAVDNSLLRVFPPRLALQPMGDQFSAMGRPWHFELIG